MRDFAPMDAPYAYYSMHVTDEVAHDAAIDALDYALKELRHRVVRERGGLEGFETVILPPDGHERASDEWRMRRWTVALTENPTDFVRRLAGVAGYSLT